MATKVRAKKYAQVEIEFSDEAPVAYEGTVVLRGNEMVIDIPGNDGKTRYLIVGKPVTYFYQGVNSAGELMPKVLAKWAKLGTVFVGQWIEGGQEFLFSFKLND